jgi:hypothetical protein
VQDVDPRVRQREGVRQRAGAVRTEVVDHQDVGGRQHGQHRRHDEGEVERLVVGGEHHEGPGPRALPGQADHHGITM